MLGLDAAGKTTILYKLHIGEVLSTVPTIGGLHLLYSSLQKTHYFHSKLIPTVMPPPTIILHFASLFSQDTLCINGSTYPFIVLCSYPSSCFTFLCFLYLIHFKLLFWFNDDLLYISSFSLFPCKLIEDHHPKMCLT